jgi:tellurite resistance protein
MKLGSLPIGLYGAVMGLAGLGLAARAAAPLFPGVFRAPAYFSEPWIALALLVFVVLVFLYSSKILFEREAVKAEFTNPAQMGFCAALPVGMTILAAGLAPYLPAIADVLWWTGVALLVAFQAWGFYRLIFTPIALAQVNAGWLILFVGGIVAPAAGVVLGHAKVSTALFAFSAALSVLLVGLLLVRMFAAPPLPEPLRPSWFILLVPPSLVSAFGPALLGVPALEYLFFVSIAFLAGVLFYLRRLPHWPFTPAWWSMTFPLDAFALSAARYAQAHPAPVWKALAGAGLVLATAAVALVLLRSAFQALRTR